MYSQTTMGQGDRSHIQKFHRHVLGHVLELVFPMQNMMSTKVLIMLFPKQLLMLQTTKLI